MKRITCTNWLLGCALIVPLAMTSIAYGSCSEKLDVTITNQSSGVLTFNSGRFASGSSANTPPLNLNRGPIVPGESTTFSTCYDLLGTDAGSAQGTVIYDFTQAGDGGKPLGTVMVTYDRKSDCGVSFIPVDPSTTAIYRARCSSCGSCVIPSSVGAPLSGK